jgi:ankyrin repeat protein
MGRVNVEATTKDGRSALAVAAERGHGGVVAYLIEAGAKVGLKCS